MLLKGALVLIVAWLLGVLGPYDGDAVHILLLVGLMLLLLAFAKGREAAVRAERRANHSSEQPPGTPGNR